MIAKFGLVSRTVRSYGRLVVIGMTNIDTIWKAKNDIVLSGSSNLGYGENLPFFQKPLI